jgi:predicted metal-dependent phosphoesterase TrpH
MRCDLHVHSWYSGPVGIPALRRLGRECYSDPLLVHELALGRGMDLVTLTDHDTIAGGLRLMRLPNTFLSEEVTVELPGGRQLHVNVFDIDEGQHEAIQARRRDAEALFAWLAEQRIPAAVNHLFSALTGERRVEDLTLALGRLAVVETINGAMPESQNQAAGRVGRAAGLGAVGGSDAHAAAHVARAFTTVAGARDKQEFVDGLRRGLSVPGGRSGSYARLTGEITRVLVACGQETACELLRGEGSFGRAAGLLALLPLVPLLPLVTLALFGREVLFGRRCLREFQREHGWPLDRRRPRVAVGRALGEAA